MSPPPHPPLSLLLLHIRRLPPTLRYQFQRKDPVKINPAQIKESSSRLSQPKKSNYTDDEINKIYGF